VLLGEAKAEGGDSQCWFCLEFVKDSKDLIQNRNLFEKLLKEAEFQNLLTQRRSQEQLPQQDLEIDVQNIKSCIQCLLELIKGNLPKGQSHKPT